MLNTKEIEHSIDSPLTKGVAPAKPETGVVQLLKDADAHADCKAELIFYDSNGYPSVTYKLTGKMVRKLVER
jgi:arginase family enzyme